MSLLLTPLTIGSFTLRNRIALPPMVITLAPGLGSIAGDGDPVTDQHIAHYSRIARAGTGLICVEATCVSEGGRCWAQGLGAYADEHVPGLARLAAAIKAEGALAAVQLVHGGPQASADLVGRPVGPSETPSTGDNPGVHELTLAELAAVQDDFVAAAERAAAAGFEAVVVHGAHGYLLDSFLIEARNRRTDAYGGSLAGRARMMVETCAKVKAALGDRLLTLCRISIWNKAEGEFAPEALRELVSALEGTGLDGLDISTDGILLPCFGEAKGVGQWVKEMTDLPTVIAGGVQTPEQAEQVLAEGHADLVAVGKAMLADPDWARQATEAG